jgi:hypothetical protein
MSAAMTTNRRNRSATRSRTLGYINTSEHNLAVVAAAALSSSSQSLDYTSLDYTSGPGPLSPAHYSQRSPHHRYTNQQFQYNQNNGIVQPTQVSPGGCYYSPQLQRSSGARLYWSAKVGWQSRQTRRPHIMLRDLLTQKCVHKKKVTHFGYPRACRFRKHQIENRFLEFFQNVILIRHSPQLCTSSTYTASRENQLTSASVRCAEISSQNKFCLFRHLNLNGCG